MLEVNNLIISFSAIIAIIPKHVTSNFIDPTQVVFVVTIFPTIPNFFFLIVLVIPS